MNQNPIRTLLKIDKISINFHVFFSSPLNSISHNRSSRLKIQLTLVRTRNATAAVARESCLIDLLNAIKSQLIHNMSDLIDGIEQANEQEREREIDSRNLFIVPCAFIGV